MEQGLTRKSHSTSSEQNQQPYFVGSHSDYELSQVVQPLAQGFSKDNEMGYGIAQTTRFQPSNLELTASSQNKQADDTGASLSGAAFSGELVAQSHGANEDLFAVYVKGISHARDQHSFQENQMLRVDDQFTQDARNHEAMINSSHFHMAMPASSSRFEGQWVGSSQISAPFGNLLGDSTVVNTLHPDWTTNGSSVQLRFGINQGIANPINVSSFLLNQGSGKTNMASGSSYHAQGPTISGQKRKMNWQDHNAPNHRRWNAIMHGEQEQSSRTSVSSSERFTLYDKRYEEMGVPLDPHLRIFNATKGKGTGGSK